MSPTPPYTHTDLPDAGLTPHHVIDAKLDSLDGHRALPGNLALAPGQALYFLASGNVSPQQNGNWRITMDGDDLVIQVRASGTWQTEARFTP